MLTPGARGNLCTSFMNTVKKALFAIGGCVKRFVVALGRKFKALGIAVKNWSIRVWKAVIGTTPKKVNKKGK